MNYEATDVGPLLFTSRNKLIYNFDWHRWLDPLKMTCSQQVWRFLFRVLFPITFKSVYISCGFFVCIKCFYPSNGDGKNSVTLFLHGIICVQESGNYHVFFWSMTSKAEFVSESPDQFLYICSIYVARTHLAPIFYEKMEQIYKNRSGL